MGYGVHFPYMLQELVAQTLSTGGAGDQPGDVHELDHVGDDVRGTYDVSESVETPIRYLDHANIRIDRAEGIVFGRNGNRRQSLKQSGLADVRESDDADR
jgi:hypothetical protein